VSEPSKHIALYTDDPEFGGVAQYNHSVLLMLIAQGYRVTCIQPRSGSPLVKAQQAAGIQHEWIGFDAQKDFTRSITDLADAERILGKIDPDFIIFSDCCPVSNIAARHAAVTRGIPYIVVVNFVAKYLAEKFKGCLGVLAKQHAYAQAVVAVSQENLDLLRNYFGTPAEKGVVIHYGRPAKYFAHPSAETRARLRAEMNIPTEGIVCFSAARLTPIKGFQHILSAAAALKNTLAWAHLYFVWAGDGELRADLQKHIDMLGMSDRFRLLGQRWDVCDLHEAADMFALPSHFEGMPLTIMEAMARRVPVVASAVSGIPEELGDTGCLIPSPEMNAEATVKGLAEAIARWTLDPAARGAAAEKSHARAQEFFREELMLARVTKLVGDALLHAPAKKPAMVSAAAKLG